MISDSDISYQVDHANSHRFAGFRRRGARSDRRAPPNVTRKGRAPGRTRIPPEERPGQPCRGLRAFARSGGRRSGVPTAAARAEVRAPFDTKVIIDYPKGVAPAREE